MSTNKSFLVVILIFFTIKIIAKYCTFSIKCTHSKPHCVLSCCIPIFTSTESAMFFKNYGSPSPAGGGPPGPGGPVITRGFAENVDVDVARRVSASAQISVARRIVTSARRTSQCASVGASRVAKCGARRVRHKVNVAKCGTAGRARHKGNVDADVTRRECGTAGPGTRWYIDAHVARREVWHCQPRPVAKTPRWVLGGDEWGVLITPIPLRDNQHFLTTRLHA